ncbi:hypothetical protein V6N13_072071 [Hibiscus sabdariffa]|uniref:Uncharacterized protein n=1 Tax=Hibiscus sabdariffa TaxID=183260 RepID=A0ABR2TCC6_9ROSI
MAAPAPPEIVMDELRAQVAIFEKYMRNQCGLGFREQTLHVVQEHPNSPKRPSPTVREVMAALGPPEIVIDEVRLRAQISIFEKYIRNQSGLEFPEEALYVGVRLREEIQEHPNSPKRPRLLLLFPGNEPENEETTHPQLLQLFPGNEPENQETTRPQLLQLLPGAENGNQELVGAGVGATQTDGINIRDPLPPSVGEATPRAGINIRDRQQPSGEGVISARRHQGDAASEQRD